jgi:L-fucose mutarotase
MLKGLDPLLNANVLYALRAMGHGDDVVVCDANFPADAIARQTALGELLRIDGADAPRVVRAILSVLPLDTFVDHPALRMEVVDAPETLMQVHRDVQAELAGGGHAAERRRAVCLLRAGEAGVLRDRYRRGAPVRLLHLQEGWDRAVLRLSSSGPAVDEGGPARRDSHQEVN